MSSPRTFLQMRTRARQLADMEGSEFVSETELKDIVNEQIAELWDILIEARGEEYARKEFPVFKTVVGQRQYLLPADYYRLTNVAAGDGSLVRSLRRFEDRELGVLINIESGGGGWDIYRTMYAVIKDKLELRPVPQTAFDVHLHYLSKAPTLIDDLDEFDGINGWEKWVEVSSAIVMLEKEESDSSSLQMQLARVEARIRKLAPTRDQANPPRILDVRGDMYFPDLVDDWNG